MDGGDAARTAAALAESMSRTTDEAVLKPLAEATVAALTGSLPPPPRDAKAVATAAALPAGLSNLPTTLAVLTLVKDPPPCRLSTPQLGELLKQPLCLGQARRVILDQLEIRHHRRFADHWDFVRFAEKDLSLDLSGPPSRLSAGAVEAPQ
jgi:hypothetical protein